MRNLDKPYRRSCTCFVRGGVGFALADAVVMQQVGTDPNRHWTDIATNMQTPERVFVDLTPYGEREVLDARD